MVEDEETDIFVFFFYCKSENKTKVLTPLICSGFSPPPLWGHDSLF